MSVRSITGAQIGATSSRKPGAGQLALDIPGWSPAARAVLAWSARIHGKGSSPRARWGIAAARALDAGQPVPDFPRPYLADLGASRVETATRIYAAAGE
jgi:hypothetical protein